MKMFELVVDVVKVVDGVIVVIVFIDWFFEIKDGLLIGSDCF